jgi:hypothetical protein
MFLVVDVIMVSLLLYLWEKACGEVVSGLPRLWIFVVSCISDTKWCHCSAFGLYLDFSVNYLYISWIFFSRPP